jgi:hypothetical protein
MAFCGSVADNLGSSEPPSSKYGVNFVAKATFLPQMANNDDESSTFQRESSVKFLLLHLEIADTDHEKRTLSAARPTWVARWPKNGQVCGQKRPNTIFLSKFAGSGERIIFLFFLPFFFKI